MMCRVPSALAAVLRQKGLGQAVDNSVSDQGLLAKLYRGCFISHSITMLQYRAATVQVMCEHEPMKTTLAVSGQP